MKREILFRGKDIISGEWLTGFLVDGKHIGCWVEACPVRPETVGQFTGLTDKNGKKIFEGDILEFRAGRSHIVKFDDGCFIFTGTAIPVRYADKFEVIGNIHDNPELLEGGVDNG